MENAVKQRLKKKLFQVPYIPQAKDLLVLRHLK